MAEAVVASFADNSAKLERPLRNCVSRAPSPWVGRGGYRFSARFTRYVM